MSTDADTTPTEQTILDGQAAGIGSADGTPTDQRIVEDGFGNARNETTPIPTPPEGVTPPAVSSTERTVVQGPRPVQSGVVIADRWRADHCLASGGYGDVWKGWDMAEDRPIAIKILRTDAGNNDPSAIARMRQEAEILEAIDHPNIVGVYGFGESQFGHFLAMELLDGQAIDQLLQKEGPAETRRALPLVRQLLSALSEAHDKHILHRDLKPENIIVVEQDGAEVAKLVDFGIAKASRLLNDNEDGATLVQTRAGGFMGTPRYAAPEQAVGDPCGPNIDLFALALVIAEWLTGRMRLDAETHGEVMTLLLSADEIDISDVPYRWREWLALMLKKNPRERFQSASEALEQLDHLVVALHEKADFLDEDPHSMSYTSGANASLQQDSFVESHDPLELDYDKVQQQEELRRQAQRESATLKPYSPRSAAAPPSAAQPSVPMRGPGTRGDGAKGEGEAEEQDAAFMSKLVTAMFIFAIVVLAWGIAVAFIYLMQQS